MEVGLVHDYRGEAGGGRMPHQRLEAGQVYPVYADVNAEVAGAQVRSWPRFASAANSSRRWCRVNRVVVATGVLHASS